MQFLLTLSDFIIPVTVLFIVVFGCLKRVDIYETFLEGAKEGLQTVIDILPTLIGLIMAVEVVRAGGLLDIMTDILRPAAEKIGFPAELAPLSLVRLVEGPLNPEPAYFEGQAGLNTFPTSQPCVPCFLSCHFL